MRAYRAHRRFFPNGFTLIEIVFAVLLLAFFIYFIANSFVTTKRQHGMNAEYITKAYVADIVVKLLKERIEVNPNFLAGINGLAIAPGNPEESRSCLVNPMAASINYRNLLEKNDFRVEVKDIPVISYSDDEKKEGFYFGLVEFKPGSNLFADGGKVMKTFLNIDELAKYSYDLKIANDDHVAPKGVVKNIEIAVRFSGRDEIDKKPYILATKIICPVNSLSSASYREMQKNLFQEMALDIYDNINSSLARTGFTLASLIAGIERDCKASPYSAMKVIDLSMPESAPDRPRAEKAFKAVLVFHCALELYQEAISEIDAALQEFEGKADVISIVRVMDSSIQKAQWAIQVFEAIDQPLDHILAGLEPGGVAPPNPDSMFNYQVPIMVMRYLLSRSEKDNSVTRAARFIEIADRLPLDFSQSLDRAFTRVNGLLRDNYRKLTPRQIQKYGKDLLSFHNLVRINASKLRIGGNRSAAVDYSERASATLDLVSGLYKNNAFLAGNEFIDCEKQKLQQFNSMVSSRFAEIVKKIEGFNSLEGRLTRLKKRLEKIDEVARGEEAVKLVSAPYEVNMEKLSQVYISGGRQAVQSYLERCQAEYEASLRD